MSAVAQDAELQALEPLIAGILKAMGCDRELASFRMLLECSGTARKLIVRPTRPVDVIELARLMRRHGGADAKVIEGG